MNNLQNLIAEFEVEKENAILSKEQYLNIGYNEIEKAFSKGAYHGKELAFSEVIQKLTLLLKNSNESNTA